MAEAGPSEKAARNDGYTVSPTLDEASGPRTAEDHVPVGKLIQAGLRGTRDDYEYSLHTFYKTPCFRQALMWGIGLGTALALHRFKETGNIVRAADSFVMSWAAVSVGGWAFCRQNELKQLSAVQDWQKERLTGVDITDGAPMELPPAPREPGDDRR